MSLQADQMLLHYRIVEPLGRGGMGEVWRAVDTKLDREVALKVLPEALAKDPERVARFEREAKAVARLSHPNIVTVHSVEEAEGVRFVTMEIVRGRTLAELIPKGGLALDRLFELAIPLADAVAAAHRQGVTHRDLKPGNVMVSDEGRVKVLDFGLARVIGAGASGEAQTQLRTEPVTGEGQILGTVAYMSPEQAEGRSVDHRSDVFSLGVVLYEMATGRRPFQGDTPVSTISAILKDSPPSVTELRRSLPAHLGRVVRRCLAKDPDRRYQTALDLRNELQGLKEEIDSGPSYPGERPEPPRRRRWLRGVAVVAAAGLLLVIGYAAREVLRNRSHPPGTVSDAGSLKMVPLTQSGTARSAALSPDGRYLAYVSFDGGTYHLRIKQIAAGSDREIFSEGGASLLAPQVSPDGEYVYFVFIEAHQGAVERIPILGGVPEKILDDVSGEFALSPGGRRIAFLRENGESQEIFVASSDGTGARRLAAGSAWFSTALTWSSDGQQLIICTFKGSAVHVEILPVSGGPSRELGQLEWTSILAMATLPGGREVLVSGAVGPNKFQLPDQIWRLDLTDASLERLTQDLDTYTSLSLDRSGDRLATVQRRLEHSIWVLPGESGDEAHQVSFTSQSGPYWAGVVWLTDGRLVFEDLDGENLELCAADRDGSEKQRLTRTGGCNMGAAVSADGTTVAYFSDRGGPFRIWLSDADGGHPRPLTTGESLGDEVFPQFSPDGQWVYYHVIPTDGGPPEIRRAPVAGGASEKLAQDFAMFPTVSPDGKRLAFTSLDPADHQFKIVVTDLDSKEIIAKIDHDFSDVLPVVRWTPDGTGVAAATRTGSATNIVVHSLSGGVTRQITHFTEGSVLGFGWSPDGADLAVVQARSHSDVVLITGFRRDRNPGPSP